ncbi:MAG TPA: 30S ribosome-binding factor RbfA [Bdellovibrionota bacterium]|nr:30S ribosome-binding factor RbfA [Bdellovibrionota bacterium]
MKQRHPFKRSERVSDLLRQVVSEILMRRIKHVGVEDVTITGAKVSDDLQHAMVYYRVMNPEKREEVGKKLRRLIGSVRREVGHEMKLRYTPELRFEYDESLEYGDRIDELLKEVHVGQGGEEE